MNASAKRAFYALATVSVLTVTVFSIVALTAVPVSADYVTTEYKTVGLTPNSGTSGNVGDAMTFTVTVTNVQDTHWEGPTPPNVAVNPSAKRLDLAQGVSGTFSFSGRAGLNQLHSSPIHLEGQL